MITGTVYGRIGKEPEFKELANGEMVLNFSVASNSAKKDRDTTWVRVAIFGKRAETLSSMLHVKDRVCVSGRLEQRKWTSANGSGVELEMNASEVALVETKDESGARGERREAPRQQQQQQQRPTSGGRTRF